MRVRSEFLALLLVGCGRSQLQNGDCAVFGFEEAHPNEVDPSFAGLTAGPSVIANARVYSTRGPTLDSSALDGLPAHAAVDAWVDENWTTLAFWNVQTGGTCEVPANELVRVAEMSVTLGSDVVGAVPGTLISRITYGVLEDLEQPMVVDDALLEVRMAPTLNGDGSPPTYLPVFAPGVAALLDDALLETLPEGAILHPDGPAEGFIDLDLRWTLGEGAEERPLPENLDLTEHGSFTYVVQVGIDGVVEAHTLRVSFDLVDAP